MPRLNANISFLFTELPWEQCFDAAARAGFRAVELNAPAPYIFSECDFARRLTDAGLECKVILTPGEPPEAMGLASLLHQSAKSRFRVDIERAIGYAQAARVPLVHPLAGLAPDSIDRRAAGHAYVENIRMAAEMAAAAGLAIRIEPVCSFHSATYHLKTTAQAVDAINAVAMPNVKIICDVFHAQMEEGHIAATLRSAFPHIGHMQIPNPPDRHEPGAGEIDFDYLSSLLDDLGYGGWWGCEYYPSTNTTASLKWARRWGIGERN